MFVRRALVIGALTFAAFAASQAPGTWKLNAAKSKYIGIPAPKEMTVVFSSQGQGWKYDAKGVSAEGQPTTMSFAYEKDGADMPVTGFPYAETIVLKGGSTDSVTATFKRGGKAVGSANRTISKDGRTMTVDATLTLPDGKKASYVAVYEKQ